MFIIVKRAIVIQGEEDEDGKQEPLSAMDFSLHFLTFFWKVLFAFVPPRSLKILQLWFLYHYITNR